MSHICFNIADLKQKIFKADAFMWCFCRSFYSLNSSFCFIYLRKAHCVPFASKVGYRIKIMYVTVLYIHGFACMHASLL